MHKSPPAHGSRYEGVLRVTFFLNRRRLFDRLGVMWLQTPFGFNKSKAAFYQIKTPNTKCRFLHWTFWRQSVFGWVVVAVKKQSVQSHKAWSRSSRPKCGDFNQSWATLRTSKHSARGQVIEMAAHNWREAAFILKKRDVEDNASALV